jgi:hypothetical protein
LKISKTKQTKKTHVFDICFDIYLYSKNIFYLGKLFSIQYFYNEFYELTKSGTGGNSSQAALGECEASHQATEASEEAMAWRWRTRPEVEAGDRGRRPLQAANLIRGKFLCQNNCFFFAQKRA